MNIFQAIIPAAGMGSRLGDFSKALPKELLPVGDKAVIEHVIESIVQAGITDITVVIHPQKTVIMNYLGSGKKFNANLTYVVQEERHGLADAVRAGRHLVKEDFLVVLGDNFFLPKSILTDFLLFHGKHRADATLGVASVSDVSRYGIIDPSGPNVVDMIEKPFPQNAPSKLGCMGFYAFKPSIFDAIARTLPDERGEYQLTESIRILIKDRKKIIFQMVQGTHIDVGTPKDLIEANMWYEKYRQ